MRADKTEISWDAGKSKWQVRISAGEEVIRRYCDLPKNADQKDLRIAAEKTLHDEGYELDAAAITIQQPQAA
jgi:hypothetical protein